MKTLVIYFSHAGENYMKNGIEDIKQGNTEIVALKIKDLIGADLFKVEEVKSYSNSYRKCCDEAKEELDNNLRPAIKNTLKSIDEYKEIIIAGPIWWNHYPMVLWTQLEQLDFAGKRIKYIVTHEGSGVGGCSSDIAKLCKGGKIEKGLAIRGHLVNECDEELRNYLL